MAAMKFTHIFVSGRITMRKIKLVTIISLILILSLVGCGNNSSNNSTSSSETSKNSRVEVSTSEVAEPTKEKDDVDEGLTYDDK